MVCDGATSIWNWYSYWSSRNQCLEFLSSRTQALVPVPNQHAQRADQSDPGRRRKPARWSHHLVQSHLSQNPAPHLASWIQALGNRTKTRGNCLCTRYAQLLIPVSKLDLKLRNKNLLTISLLKISKLMCPVSIFWNKSGIFSALSSGFCYTIPFCIF